MHDEILSTDGAASGGGAAGSAGVEDKSVEELQAARRLDIIEKSKIINFYDNTVQYSGSYSFEKPVDIYVGTDRDGEMLIYFNSIKVAGQHRFYSFEAPKFIPGNIIVPEYLQLSVGEIRGNVKLQQYSGLAIGATMPEELHKIYSRISSVLCVKKAKIIEVNLDCPVYIKNMNDSKEIIEVHHNPDLREGDYIAKFTDGTAEIIGHVNDHEMTEVGY
jgi:hypothetical protein